MGADIKSLRTRIKSVDSTLHLTKAMGLVASSKIRRANEAMIKGREYLAAVRDAVGLLAACPACKDSPYMKEVQDGTERLRLIVIAGDRGLAGGYNASVFRLVREYADAEIIPIGKRACDRYGAGYASSEHFSTDDAMSLAKALCEEFKAGAFTKLGIIGTRYVSIMTQQAFTERLLPIEAAECDMAGTVFEPDELSVLDRAMPIYLAGRIFAAVRESFASEVAARRMAMDSAGKNAKKMIDELQLEYNRARQSAITQEITEIVAGSGN